MVVGAGYIAVEMAGILQSLGSDVTQVIRYDKILRNFDESISEAVTQEVEHLGINLMKNSNVRTFKRFSENHFKARDLLDLRGVQDS